MSPKPPPSLEEAFWQRVTPGSVDECWPWHGTLHQDGYGQYRVGGRKGKMWRAHRMSFLIAHGELPPEPLVIDHVCRNRACVNPAHLEAVSDAENIRRGILMERYLRFRASQTHCKRGHLLDEANLLKSSDGHRRCKTCHRDRARALRRAA